MGFIDKLDKDMFGNSGAGPKKCFMSMIDALLVGFDKIL